MKINLKATNDQKIQQKTEYEIKCRKFVESNLIFFLKKDR